jgi:hypothetical protein
MGSKNKGTDRFEFTAPEKTGAERKQGFLIPCSILIIPCSSGPGKRVFAAKSWTRLDLSRDQVAVKSNIACIFPC